MAISLTPVGQIRFNPNTFMQEVWDGQAWSEIDPHNFTAMPIHSNGIANSSIAATAVTSKIVNANDKENLYHFLKRNMRVAEYLDDSGKIDYVQLELREDEGCVWENIQRVRIK
jgi:hypothetical protein